MKPSSVYVSVNLWFRWEFDVYAYLLKLGTSRIKRQLEFCSFQSQVLVELCFSFEKRLNLQQDQIVVVQYVSRKFAGRFGCNNNNLNNIIVLPWRSLRP